MKNILKLNGIIVLVAVIGFSFAACSNGSTDDPATGLTGTFLRTRAGDASTKAEYVLTVTGTATRACVCTVTFGPSSGGDDVENGVPAVNVASSIETGLKAEPDVTDNFDISRSGATITLTAKDVGVAYNVSSSISFK